LGLDDLMSRETAFVAAATAAVFSPRTRETLRRGAVLGVAGALKVGDVVAGAARGATRGVRGQGKVPTPAAPEATPAAPAGSAGPVPAPAAARTAASRSRRTGSSSSGRTGSPSSS
jgi:hypothetical protein